MRVDTTSVWGADRMEVEYAFLARYVEPGLDGTLTITGADLAAIRVRSFPTELPMLMAVVKLKSGDSNVRFRFQFDGPEDVGSLFSTGPAWQSSPPWQTGRDRTSLWIATEGARLLIGMPGLELAKAGRYEAVVVIENGPTLRLPLDAMEGG